MPEEEHNPAITGWEEEGKSITKGGEKTDRFTFVMGSGKDSGVRLLPNSNALHQGS